MKKILKFFSLSVANIMIISSTTACSLYPWDDGGNTPIPPTPPVKHDIKYYKDKIVNLNTKIEELQSNIKQLDTKEGREDFCQSDTKCMDWQVMMVILQENVSDNQAQIQDCNYQILVLETNNNFTPEQKKQALKYLNSELKFLNQQLEFIERGIVPDFTKADKVKVQNQILLVESEINKLKS